MLPFFLLFAFILALTLFGRSRYRTTYDEELKNHGPPGATGERLARKILERAGVEGVEIAIGRGPMPDFYDPARKRLTLARQHFHGTTFTALGIAAHEAGHALQDADNFRPLLWRVSAIRATMYLSLPLILFSVVMLAVPGKMGVFTLIVGWGLLAFYNLITTPTETDATQRAWVIMRDMHPRPFRNIDERLGIKRVMKAAAAAYIEGIFSMVSWIGGWLLPWWKDNTQPDPE
jgi:Zn-dependent membrane protease YugP